MPIWSVFAELMQFGMGSFAQLMPMCMGSFPELVPVGIASGWPGVMPLGMGKVNIANMTPFMLH